MHTIASPTPAIDLGLPVPADLFRLRAPGHLVDRILRAARADTVDLRTRPQPGPGGPAPAGPDAPDGVGPTMEDLVREHTDAVYRVALSVTKDPSLAEDVTQDVLIKAWQALPGYRGDAPLRHWILRIAHNASISTLRRRREQVMAPADLPEAPHNQATVERQVQDRLAIDRFEAALGGLDGTSRSIVVLREVEGLSYAEMSDLLELPLPTIRTRLLRARRQLAAALDGWQP